MLRANSSTLSTVRFSSLYIAAALLLIPLASWADSVNSPNITMNVDTNRSTGAGAGNTAVTINTITIAETTLPEYTSGSGKNITLKVRPGYQFDSSSTVTAQSATFGINGGAVNVAASRTPTGAANETLTFTLTSGGNASVQDIIRINGIKLKILSAAGAAGPAQTTVALTTAAAGGAFTDQGIIAASITKGAADRMVFAIEPGSQEAGVDLLPQVKIVDFGGNIITTDSRTISLALQTNPGSATLLGTTQLTSANGLATWANADDLRITTAASGYVLRASHNGAAFLTSDTVDSAAFNISAGDPGGISITAQPTSVDAGSDISLTVGLVDEFSNPVTSPEADITLDSAVNPGGWPLLVDTSLTKTTVNGVASWGASDHLRITKATSGYKLSISGLGAPLQTNAFDITVGDPALLKFTVQPTTTTVDTIMTPDPAVAVTDLFGNTVAGQTNTIELHTVQTRCETGISGNSSAAVDGVATFSTLSFGKVCEESKIKASSSGLIGALSDTFDIKGEDSTPIELRSARFRPRRLVQFLSRGSFHVPDKTIDDPTKRGAVLTVTGTTGTVRYNLAKSGWSRVGAHGFRFKGNPCAAVAVKPGSISATCIGRTGTLDVPEEGPVKFVLKVGKGSAEFCGSCGGITVGDENTIFKRTNCAAPTTCP